MKKVVFIIGITILVLAIGFGIDILLAGAVMWALCKLGIIAAWTWKQAALWAVILTIVWSFLGGIFKGGK